MDVRDAGTIEDALLHLLHHRRFLFTRIVGPCQDARVANIQSNLGKCQCPENVRRHLAIVAENAVAVDILGHCGDQEEQLKKKETEWFLV